jgi:hypothetical protein
MLTRRTLIQATLAGALTPPRFQGFIVSDAHFGWVDEQQPSPDAIRQSMARILERFPSLDVLIDSGDAHHNNASDSARAGWTDIIAGGCGTLPFLYCMGNHEHGGNEDAEARSCRLGSLSCRPYQSWTIRGIHFIMAPQMMQACYVSEEALEWLELDLAAHRDITTIFVSHNSLKGTTKSGFDIGYRQVVNSPRVLDLLKRYPNVVAWMHGHNHTWELVHAFGKLFVSNGRIGGFDPGGPGASGKGHTGGIFFEVGSEYVTVRGYSVTRDAFFDEIDPGSSYMHRRLAVRTSLNPSGTASVCYGVGRARPRQRTPVWRHFAGASVRAEALLAKARTPVINENPRFELYTQRVEHGGKTPTTKILPGFAVTPRYAEGDAPDNTWEWTDPGLRLKALSSPTASRVILLPGARDGRFQYYRCSPATRLAVELVARCERPGPRAQIRCRVHDSAGEERVLLTADEFALDKRAVPFRHTFELPAAFEGRSIYVDPASNTELQVSFEVTVKELSNDVLIERLEVTLATPAPSPALSLDGRRADAGVIAAPAGARQVVESLGHASWLIRESGLEWQIRNAPSGMRDGWIEIEGLRNQFSARQEVVIAPLAGRPACFVHRLRHVRSARVLPAASTRSGITVQLVELYGAAEVDIIAAARPTRVAGADQWKYRDGCVTIARSTPGWIEVTP